MWIKFFTDLLLHVQYAEVTLSQLSQKHLQPIEPLLVFISERFSSGQLMDIFVPMVGVFNHRLMVRLIGSLSIINIVCSLIKWCAPAYRPIWWLREIENSWKQLRQHPLACETSAGFPASHSAAFTAFMYLLLVFTLNHFVGGPRTNLYCHILVWSASVLMWLSRIYLGLQFLHQCTAGSLLTLILLNWFDSNATTIYVMGKAKAISIVLGLSLIPIIAYYMMPRWGLDPHWSVRMAFKWCSDPSYLHHETSPVFIFGRDFGYLMGVTLSMPLYKRLETNSHSLVRKLAIYFGFELINTFARDLTPKQSGRFIFVSYEFMRNLIHSFTLLYVFPQIT